MDCRENMLRAARFERPDYIPMVFHINPSCWRHYPEGALQELMAEHPFLFPERMDTEPELPLVARADEPYVDDWGCLWETTQDGITGTVTGHPLSSWEKFDDFTPPDPETCSGIGPFDWSVVEKNFQSDELKQGGLRHGHTFMQLADLRGYESLIFDMADEVPGLERLIEMVEAFNLHIVNRYIELGAEWMSFPEDLGMQQGPMLSPDHLRQYILPSYRRLMAPAREAGCVVHMHSDGDIRALADDLLGCGMDVLNVQDLVNGLDWIEKRLKGKVCIDLDIDRQHITASGTPEEIDRLIRDEVGRLSSRDGGLMMIYGLYPGVPLNNVKALMDAMEKYRDR